MTMISDLSRDLIEEILYRVPISCRGRARSTCKGWNVIFNDQRFTKKHCAKAAKEFMAIVIHDSRTCLISLNLHNHKDLVESPIGNQIKVILYVCDGLLLCIPRDNYTRDQLVVWNPYLGQVRWIEPIHDFTRLDDYVMGYDTNNNYKILRIFNDREGKIVMFNIVNYEIYSFKSHSWRVVRDTFDWFIVGYIQDATLKGNTYFFAHNRLGLPQEKFLLCFDFTRERFGPRLHLPFLSYIGDCLSLSTVKDEQLAVLFQRKNAYETEIWITTKIESDALSWRTFLKFDTGGIYIQDGDFLVYEEEKKAAGIFDIEMNGNIHNEVYMIGEDGYYKLLNPGHITSADICSYAPSSVWIQ